MHIIPPVFMRVTIPAALVPYSHVFRFYFFHLASVLCVVWQRGQVQWSGVQVLV